MERSEIVGMVMEIAEALKLIAPLQTELIPNYREALTLAAQALESNIENAIEVV